MTIPKTETQKTIESKESQKAKLQMEITGMGECKTAIEASPVLTPYMLAQIAAYEDKISDFTAQIIEIDVLITKLSS
jgi:hypothetical protein